MYLFDFNRREQLLSLFILIQIHNFFYLFIKCIAAIIISTAAPTSTYIINVLIITWSILFMNIISFAIDIARIITIIIIIAFILN